MFVPQNKANYRFIYKNTETFPRFTGLDRGDDYSPRNCEFDKF